MKCRWKCYRVLILLIVSYALLCLSACGNGSSSEGNPWPSAPLEVEYAAEYGTVLPSTVTDYQNITSPENVLTGGTITLTYDQGGAAPYILLDYGKVVGGYPQFHVVSITGNPTLNSAFSESLQYVDTGDGRPFMENSLVPSRSMDYDLSGPEVIQSRLLQGSQRYQKLTLTTEGTSVTLSSIGIDSSLAGPNTTADSAGYFTSSSSALNDIWKIGAYTVDANRIDALTMPSPWTLTSQGALIPPSNPAVYQGLGLHETASTTTFAFFVRTGGVSWTVNYSFSSTVQFTLHANDDEDAPNTLSGNVGGSFSDFLRVPFTSVQLAEPLEPGTWHTVTTTSTPIFEGGLITVNLDGVDLVTAFDPAQIIAASPLAEAIPTYLALGTSGFFNQNGHVALVKDFTVSALNLDSFTTVSYSAALTDEDDTVLEDFAVGDNEVSVITDGMKRDRYSFSGDLLVCAPTLYYTTGNADPVMGVLALMGQYLDAEGQVASVVPPKLALDSTDRDAGPTNPWFSLGYSMYYVDILYDYYMYTGDLTLVSTLWPQVQSEMDYLASKQQADTLLLETDEISGFTWHPQYDATFTGTVAEYNLDYVQVLERAAALADALDMNTEADAFEDAALSVKDAVNSDLYNEDRGLYEISDTKTGFVAQDANSKAVLYGVADEEQTSAVFTALDNALDHDFGRLAFDTTYFDTYNQGLGVISPYASNWEVLARLEKGDTDSALAIIEKLWGRMIEEGDFYSGATWESLAAETGYPVDQDISLAHGWSSGPTAALSKYILGVRPVSAGFENWMIRPQTGSLSWAAGRVPTPFGPISFKWAQSYQGTPFMTELIVPNGTTGTVALPVISGAEVVRINGIATEPDSKSTLGGMTYLYLENVGPGSYSIKITAN